MNLTQPLFRTLALVALAFFTGALQAEPISRDLGDNLHYFRARVLPGDLPPADGKPKSLILDLRYALAENEAATALQTWLNAKATVETSVFVLINSDTAPALRELLATRRAHPGLITIGRIASGFEPDLVVDSSSDEERRAYDALTPDTKLATLLTENADKPRIDEASIMRARADAQEEPIEANPLDRLNPTEKKSESPPPPIDRALQRAIHLHRALLALRRL
ncbi:MAG TPA: hypothetical protein VL069_13405 [Opitutus sp.]|nr:hypothetical protein [Opitutus sp.]